MKANTFRGKNGVSYLSETRPFIGEDEAEKAFVYYCSEIIDALKVLDDSITGAEETTVIEKLNSLEANICEGLEKVCEKIDFLATELRLNRNPDGMNQPGGI